MPLIFACVMSLAVASDAQPLQYGMNTRVLTPPMGDKMRELGAGLVRLPYGWDVIEPGCKRCFDWTRTDAWRDEAKRSGLRIFGTLAYAPRWANGGHPFNYPALVSQDWYDFVYATVSRYKDDIDLWGVWNEADLPEYFHDGTVASYADLVATARSAIIAANPRARVIGPDLSWHSSHDGWFPAVMRASGALFDIVSVHWYADAPNLDQWMDTLVRPFVDGKPVWLSETGMRTCQTLFGEIGQALFYRQVLEGIYPRRNWIQALLFYDLHDPPEDDACSSAITRRDWSNRPAFLQMQSFIRAHAR
jgi:Glycosyl hydrolase catalytic core